MATAKFPLDPSTSVGKFWIAGDDPAHGSDGVCRVEDGLIEVEVASPLTDWMESVQRGVTAVTMRPAADDNELVIHAALPVQPGRATFFGARTAGRRRVHVPGSGGTEAHRMRADWCILGAHIHSPEERFTGFRIRLTHLELWAVTEGVNLEHQYKPSTKLTLTYETTDAARVPFSAFDETGAELRLNTVAKFAPPTVWGGEIGTHNLLALSGLSGWTLDEALARFVMPVQTLFTLLAGVECHVTHFEVFAGESWRPVFGHVVSHGAGRPATDQLLLTRAGFGLDLLARWCEQTARLTPAPHVVAAAISGAFQTVDAEALALTTTAEGLDRALFPGARRFAQAEVDDSIAALESSSVPDVVRAELISALRLYFADDSYPTRMLRLGERVAAAVPTCIGNPVRWKDGIRELRVQLAHSLERKGPMTDDDLLNMASLVQSLRWSLLLRLLLEAGVTNDVLAQAAEESPSYARNERFWRDRHSRIFDLAP